MGQTNTKTVRPIREDIKKLGLDVPDDVLRRLDHHDPNERKAKDVSPVSLMRDLFRIAPDCRERLLASLVLSVVGEAIALSAYAFAALAASWLLGMTDMSFSSLVWYGVATFVALLVSLILQAGSTLCSHKTAFLILHRLHKALFKKLSTIPLGYVVTHPVGVIKVLINDRTAELEDWVAHVWPELPASLFHPIVSTIILFVCDWRIGLATFATLPILFLAFALMFRHYRARFSVWSASYADLAEKSTDYVRGIPIIKAFRQGDRSYGRFASSTEFYYQSTMAWWRQSWLAQALMLTSLMSPLVAVGPVAVWLYGAHQISAFVLILSFVLPLSILPSAFKIMMSFECFTLTAMAWRDVLTLLRAKDQSRPLVMDQTPLEAHPAIHFDDVHFSYDGDVETIRGVTFDVKPQTVTAIVGPSGSGKTTLARLLVGFWDVDQGQIRIGSETVQTMASDRLMRYVSFVSQDNYLFACSIADNIRLGKPEATRAEIEEAARRAHCHDFIMSLPNGYDTVPGDAGATLSGGERQRITLARALLKPADIIVLDEATAYADPDNEALIQEGISALVRTKTLIVIAHRLHTIRGADQIVVMNEGCVEAIGRHDTLMQTSELYKTLWRHYSGEGF